MKEYDDMTHFEKLLDEFEEDALAATHEGAIPPSASKRGQRELARRNLVAFFEEIVLKNVKDLDTTVESSSNEDVLRKERDLLHEYLYCAVGDMSPAELNEASGLDALDYCKVIIDKAREYNPRHD